MQSKHKTMYESAVEFVDHTKSMLNFFRWLLRRKPEQKTAIYKIIGGLKKQLAPAEFEVFEMRARYGR